MLDVLREYRRRGVFPHNEHAPKQLAPCFVDSAHRLCAVARLLEASGEAETVELVARESNYARIREMQFADLDSWSKESGLSKDELARVQPGYPDRRVNVFDQKDTAQTAWELVHLIWLLFGLALISIVANSLRLCFAYANRYLLGVSGLIVGLLLVAMAIKFDLEGSQLHWSERSILRMVTPWVLVGSICLFVSCALMCIRDKIRRLAKPDCREPDQIAPVPTKDTGIKRIKGWD
jgi:hypothetical protein